MCVHYIGGRGGGGQCIGRYHEYIGEYHDACGGARWQKPFNFYWKPQCAHGIPHMHASWYPLNVLNIPRCTHDVLNILMVSPDVLNIPDVLMIPPPYVLNNPRCTYDIHRCTHGIPMYWTSPMYSWYPLCTEHPRCTHDIHRCTHGILQCIEHPRCTHDTPMYSWYPPMYSWYPPMYSWYPPMYSWYPPMYSWYPLFTEHPLMYSHYTGWVPQNSLL